MALLNMTQRQMCEKLSDNFAKSAQESEKTVALIATLISEETAGVELTFSPAEMESLGLVYSNGAYRRCCVSDDAITNDGQTNFPVIFRVDDEVWDEDHPGPITIMDFVHQLGFNTMADAFGSPISSCLNNSSSTTLLHYAQTHYDYGVVSSSGTIVLEYKDLRFELATVNYQDGIYTIRINDLINDIDQIAKIAGCFSFVSTLNAMYHDITSALSNALCSPSDLFAVLEKYLSSNWKMIADRARDIIRMGSGSLQEAINSILLLFRDANSFVENDDGSITWITPGSKINSSAWAVALQLAANVGQVIGYALIFSGAIAMKIVGGALILASSIGQAALSTVGQITGTSPYINDNAIDDVYADPVFQGNETLKGTWLTHSSETLSALTESKRVKLLTPWCIIYLYNAKQVDDGWNVDYKVFVRMRGSDPNLFPGNRTLGSIFNGFRFSYDYEQTSPKWFKYAFTPSDSWSNNYDCINSAVMFSNPSNMLNISRTSGSAIDADNWHNLWLTLASNTIYTLMLPLSSPFFMHNNIKVMASNALYTNTYDGYSDGIEGILKGVHGMLFNNMSGSYADVVNAIAFFTNFDNGSNNVLVSTLISIGILEVPYTDAATMIDVNRKISFDPSAAAPWSNEVNLLSYSYPYQDNRSTVSLWSDNYYYVVPFIAVDQHNYVIPPEHDFKSILWGAIIVAGTVAIVVSSIFIARAIVSRKVRQTMQRVGQNLMADGQVFRNGWTNEEWNQLSPSDKAEYNRAFKSYNLKIKLYNFAANLLGLSSIDWQNNWWSENTSAGALPMAVASTQGANIVDLMNSDSVKTATAAGLSALGVDIASEISPVKTKVDDVSTDVDQVDSKLNSVYYAITGRNPS